MADTKYNVSSKHNVLQELQPGFNRLKIGDSVKFASFKTVQGQKISLDELVAKGPVAIVFMGVKWPVSQRYTLRLNRLIQKGIQCISSIAVFHPILKPRSCAEQSSK